MIKYIVGNLFESKADALVNTVNTVGIMGKGIALQFKKLFPSNYKIYKELCDKKEFKIGKLLIVEDQNIVTGEKIIEERNIKSIAIPPLGSGNGGLQWYKVKLILENKLSNIDCDISIYEPNSRVKDVLNKERVKLTPARAMLLFMLFELVKHGEFVSEFASEKLCYFLQRFGGEKHFNLNYSPNFYGPYSGKVKHVLNYLNGSYLMGYGGKDKKPFEELNLLIDAEIEVKKYIEDNIELKQITERTSSFLNGFYSYYGLELLSTVDYIAQTNNTSDKKIIKKHLSNWSARKKSLFSNDEFIDISINQLKHSNLLNS